MVTYKALPEAVMEIGPVPAANGEFNAAVRAPLVESIFNPETVLSRSWSRRGKCSEGSTTRELVRCPPRTVTPEPPQAARPRSHGIAEYQRKISAGNVQEFARRCQGQRYRPGAGQEWRSRDFGKRTIARTDGINGNRIRGLIGHKKQVAAGVHHQRRGFSPAGVRGMTSESSPVSLLMVNKETSFPPWFAA